MMRWLLALLGLSPSKATANPLPGPGKLGLLVPAYFYPGPADQHWQALGSAAHRVPLTVIVNPASGPGLAADPAYTNAVSQIRAAGAKAIGYVPIAYAKRPINQALADVNCYRRFYDLDGIFIDEVASDDSADTEHYQAALIRQIREQSPEGMVVTNPGVPPHPKQLGEHGADLIVSFENTGEQWLRAFQSSRTARLGSTRQVNAQFAHLVHSTVDETSMRTIVSGAAAAGIHSIYVTNDVMDNPWDTLPCWWISLLNQVEAINRDA